jgi:hypothetical protein
MMILKMARQYAARVTLVDDDNMIQAFTADRTDQLLDVGVLPGRSRGVRGGMLNLKVLLVTSAERQRPA